MRMRVEHVRNRKFLTDLRNRIDGRGWDLEGQKVH